MHTIQIKKNWMFIKTLDKTDIRKDVLSDKMIVTLKR